jgi:hypothetical protein
LTGGLGGPDRGIDAATSSTTPMQRCARNGSASARTGTTIRRQVDGCLLCRSFLNDPNSSTIRKVLRWRQMFSGDN